MLYPVCTWLHPYTHQLISLCPLSMDYPGPQNNRWQADLLPLHWDNASRATPYQHGPHTPLLNCERWRRDFSFCGQKCMTLVKELYSSFSLIINAGVLFVGFATDPNKTSMLGSRILQYWPHLFQCSLSTTHIIYLPLFSLLNPFPAGIQVGQSLPSR